MMAEEGSKSRKPERGCEYIMRELPRVDAEKIFSSPFLVLTTEPTQFPPLRELFVTILPSSLVDETVRGEKKRVIFNEPEISIPMMKIGSLGFALDLPVLSIYALEASRTSSTSAARALTVCNA